MLLPFDLERSRRAQTDSFDSPLANALRGDPGRGDRSPSAVLLTLLLHLGVAGAIGYASLHIASPPGRATIKVMLPPLAPAMAPPPLKGDPSGKHMTKPPEVKPEAPKQLVAPRPDPHTPPAIVAPTEQPVVENDEVPYGVANGDVNGDPNGQDGGTAGGDPTGIVEGVGRGGGDAPLIPMRLDQAKLLKKVDPIYSTLARHTGAQGIVVLDAIIGVDGRVEEIQVMRSVHLLDDAAVAALRQWEFEPARFGGKLVKMRLTVSMEFKLAH